MLPNDIYIYPECFANHKTSSLITTRNGGISLPPFNSLNLGAHVGDNPQHVALNREILNKALPSEPFWLEQTHSNRVINLDKLDNDYVNRNFDASFTRSPNKVCAVMTADCLPILLTDGIASFVAAIHAGWRGVHNEIIKQTMLAINHKQPKQIIAYIGPSICQSHFEVGSDVKEQFIELNPQNKYFFKTKADKFECDVTAIAINQLLSCGLTKENIHLSNMCTYCDQDKFYSYRRDGNATGRIASLIWINHQD